MNMRLVLLLIILVTSASASTAATRLGLHVTQEEIYCWRQRAGFDSQGANGIICPVKYKSTGDVSPNSPGDWDRISARAESFRSSWLANDTGGSTNRELNGDLGVAAFWAAALTDAEAAAFAAGVHPRKIRPLALVSCPHVNGLLSPEIDECGTTSWAVTGSPAQAGMNPPVGLFSMTFGR